MTHTPPKPKRRRWRWLAVGMLLLASFTSWWQWPTIDDRFVGHWKVTGDNLSFPAWEITLSADGSCNYLGGGEPLRAVREMWAVNRDTLYLFDKDGLWITSYVRGWLRSHIPFNGGRYKVLSVGDDAIKMTQLGQAIRRDEFALERVSAP